MSRQWSRRAFSVAGVAALAGCSSLPGGSGGGQTDGDPTETDGDPTETDGDPTETDGEPTDDLSVKGSATVEGCGCGDTMATAYAVNTEIENTGERVVTGALLVVSFFDDEDETGFKQMDVPAIAPSDTVIIRTPIFAEANIDARVEVELNETVEGAYANENPEGVEVVDTQLDTEEAQNSSTSDSYVITKPTATVRNTRSESVNVGAAVYAEREDGTLIGGRQRTRELSPTDTHTYRGDEMERASSVGESVKVVLFEASTDEE